jgi:hypothetical protein
MGAKAMSENPAMTFWVTKFALSSGIFVENCTVRGEYAYGGDRWSRQYRIGRDCFELKADAIARADEMRLAKIASLKKQLGRIEQLRFKP